MGIEINLTPEDIDRLVKESIINAGFGKAITEGVTKIFTGYNNPVQEQLQRYVKDVTYKLITENYEEQIKEAVHKKLTEILTDEVVDEVTYKVVKKFEQNLEENRY